MEKGKIIQQIVGEGLKPFGFEYKGYKLDAWQFEKKFKNVTQTISIYQYRFDSSMISFDIFTDVRGKGIKQAVDIEGLHFNSNIPGFWKFEDDKTFVEVLQTMTKVMIESGLKILDELSQESEIAITNEMYEKLYYNHEEMGRKFKEKYDLDDTILDENHINQWFDVIEERTKELKKHPYNEIKDDLVEMAAFLGEQLVRHLGGYWERYENKKNVSCFVDGINSEGNQVNNVLKVLIGGYSKNGIAWSKFDYMEIYENRNI